mmetsp:Transcript_4737/g.11271  ORF Transcript_4737/g.11271 Transcript_4737/m.11271 type:complete len:204 (-) Transcript_4737:957-1568(-)
MKSHWNVSVPYELKIQPFLQSVSLVERETPYIHVWERLWRPPPEDMVLPTPHHKLLHRLFRRRTPPSSPPRPGSVQAARQHSTQRPRRSGARQAGRRAQFRLQTLRFVRSMSRLLSSSSSSNVPCHWKLADEQEYILRDPVRPQQDEGPDRNPPGIRLSQQGRTLHTDRRRPPQRTRSLALQRSGGGRPGSRTNMQRRTDTET